MEPRIGIAVRESRETKVDVSVNLDGKGEIQLNMGLGFLGHMLTLVACHGSFDMRVDAEGDLEVDDHHLVEDIGICLGQAFRQALGGRIGIERYGCSYIPMDEALVETVIDISGRPWLTYEIAFTREMLGEVSTEVFEDFWRGFAQHAGITMHMTLVRGKNNHHIAEAMFKSVARSLKIACSLNDREGVPSSKGMLDC